jgi:hypothetical protein
MCKALQRKTRPFKLHSPLLAAQAFGKPVAIPLELKDASATLETVLCQDSAPRRQVPVLHVKGDFPCVVKVTNVSCLREFLLLP